MFHRVLGVFKTAVNKIGGNLFSGFNLNLRICANPFYTGKIFLNNFPFVCLKLFLFFFCGICFRLAR